MATLPHQYHDLWRPRHGAEMDPADVEMRSTPYHVPHRLHGQGHEAMFPGGKLVAKPFAAGPAHVPGLRNVNGHDPIKETIRGAVKGDIHPELIDPRWLRMSQPAVTSSGVHYYMHDPSYRESGVTYADQHQVGNMHPLVYQHEGLGMRMILAGHHRAAAALASGQPLRALVVRDEHWK